MSSLCHSLSGKAGGVRAYADAAPFAISPPPDEIDRILAHKHEVSPQLITHSLSLAPVASTRPAPVDKQYTPLVNTAKRGG